VSDEPVRWTEDEGAPDELRALLRLGRAVGPMPSDVRAGVLATLPTGGGGGSGGSEGGRAPTTTPSSPAASPASKAVLASSMSKAIAAVAVVGAVGAGIAASRMRPRASIATPATSSVTAPSAPSSPLTPPTPAEPPASAEAVPPAARSCAPIAAPTRPVAGRAPGDAREGDPLAAESALVTRARQALASDPAAALAAVDEHARRFPRGELAPEREYVRISALRRLGRTDEVRARATRYLTTYGSSPYAPAVRKILSEVGP